MNLHKHLLRAECNYTGPMTQVSTTSASSLLSMLINRNSWWDETRDAGNYINSPILDPVSGFGGNGSSVDLCVVDGPFANSTVHLGPADSDTPAGFCLKRRVNETFAAGAAQSIVDGCMNITDYANACIWCIGVSPHTAYVISTSGLHRSSWPCGNHSPLAEGSLYGEIMRKQI